MKLKKTVTAAVIATVVGWGGFYASAASAAIAECMSDGNAYGSVTYTELIKKGRLYVPGTVRANGGRAITAKVTFYSGFLFSKTETIKVPARGTKPFNYSSEYKKYIVSCAAE